MQFFGDKYGDTVRVVQIGGAAGSSTATRWNSAAARTRARPARSACSASSARARLPPACAASKPLPALTAYDVMNLDRELIKTVAGKVNSPIHELEKKIEALLAQQKELEKALKAAQQREAAGRAKDLLASAETINGTPAIIANLGAADGDTLQTVADALKGRFKGVIVVLGGPANSAVIAGRQCVSPDFTAKVQAGKIIQTIAPIVGGKGGGKPDNARGGGKDASKLDEALAKGALAFFFFFFFFFFFLIFFFFYYTHPTSPPHKNPTPAAAPAPSFSLYTFFPFFSPAFSVFFSFFFFGGSFFFLFFFLQGLFFLLVFFLNFFFSKKWGGKFVFFFLFFFSG